MVVGVEVDGQPLELDVVDEGEVEVVNAELVMKSYASHLLTEDFR